MSSPTATFLLSVRPAVEIVAIRTGSETMILTPVSEVAGSAAGGGGGTEWIATSLYPATSDVDLVSLASSISLEALQLAREWRRAVSRSTSATFFFLLTAGGFIYLLYKRNGSGDGTDPRHSPSSRRRRKPRWRPRSWFWWFFEGEDNEDLVPEVFTNESTRLKGQYFGPPPSTSAAANATASAFDDGAKSQVKRKGASSTSSSTSSGDNAAHKVHVVAPCPNCERGMCRLKKHFHYQQQLMQEQQQQRSSQSSSYSNSPMHPQQKLADASTSATASLLLPPTSTPESADDEASGEEDVGHDDENCAKNKARRFNARFFAASGNVKRLNEKNGSSPILPMPKKTAKLFCAGRGQRRLPPDGRERATPSSSSATTTQVTTPTVQTAPRCGDANCTDTFCLATTSTTRMTRDLSIDSVASASAADSMYNIVRGAREVRRLIRDASFDSLASEYSLDLDLNREVVASTEFGLDKLQQDIKVLIDNCHAINDDVPVAKMSASKSEFGLGAAADSSPPSPATSLNGSSPDLRVLQRPTQQLWRLTGDTSLAVTATTFSNQDLPSSSSAGETLEWESPSHAWHDLRAPEHKMALGGGQEDSPSSNVSSVVASVGSSINGDDPWEWDSEGLSPEEMADWNDMRSHLGGRHGCWLPTNPLELDLESELYLHNTSRSNSASASASTSRANSRRGSLDRAASSSFHFRRMVRQPPSGRSSVALTSPATSANGATSGANTPRQPINYDDLVKSFGVRRNNSSSSLVNQSSSGGGNDEVMLRSAASDESGFLDGMESSVTSSGTAVAFANSVILSPVHEAKEPSSSAVGTPVKRQQQQQHPPKCNKAKRNILRSDQIDIVDVDESKS